MSVTTVGTIIGNAKLILQEVTAAGTRWTNEELIGWLNEAYQVVVQAKPDASSVNEDLTLATGTKQTIPASGQRLLEVVRNTAPTSQGMGVLVATRRSLDLTRRSWHKDTESIDIEQYMFDDLDPTHFYVYPPAASGAQVEIIYSAVPTPHDASSGLTAIAAETIKLPDTYAPIITDYILYRAYSKDAGHAANLQRATMHMNMVNTGLGVKAQSDMTNSPNAPDGSSNVPRGS